jgi:hypothetical protein
MAFCQPAAQTPLAAQTYYAEAGFLPHSTPIMVKTRQAVSGINFHLAPAGLLIVTVLDSSGAPVPGAILLSFLVAYERLTSGTRSPPTTDASGSANLANVPLRSQLGVATPAGNFYWWDGAPSKNKSQVLVIPAQGNVLAVTVTLPPGT